MPKSAIANRFLEWVKEKKESAHPYEFFVLEEGLHIDEVDSLIASDQELQRAMDTAKFILGSRFYSHSVYKRGGANAWEAAEWMLPDLDQRMKDKAKFQAQVKSSMSQEYLSGTLEEANSSTRRLIHD